jgi:hypothetical protein
MADERNPESLEQQVAAIKWWHTIDLGNGIVTPGLDPTRLGFPSCRSPMT